MKTNTSALVAAAALAASLAHGAIVPDADTILYVNCETEWGFGQNLATAADKLVNVHRKNDGNVYTENAASSYVRDGVSGTATANGGYLYNGNSSPTASWAANNYTEGDFTFEMFFRLDTDIPTSGDYYYVVDHDGEQAWKIQWDAGKFYIMNRWSTIASPTGLNDGKWHHFAIVQDRTAGTISAYIDYALAGSKAEVVQANASSENMVIGAMKRTDQYNYYKTIPKCAFDEIRLVKRALAPTEFLFQRTMPVDSDTVAYMSFNSTKDAKYDIALGSGALGVVQGKWGSYSSGISGSDAAAATLYPEARSQYGFTDGGVLSVSCGNNGNGGFGYSFSNPDSGILTNSFTAETFVKFTSAPAPYYGWVFYQREDVNGSRSTWGLVLAQDGCLGFNVLGTNHNTTTNLVDSTWHHLAAIYDASLETLSFYLDHALFECYEGVAFTTADKWLFFGLKEGGIGHENEAWQGVNGALYDELRITKRALKPTEFITPESIAGADPTMHARFEEGYGAMAAGRYAVDGVASAVGTGIGTAARASREILNADKQVLFANTNGVALSGGTVAYQGNGVFDLDAATAEFFVKAAVGSAGDSVVAFAATGAANPVWRLSADGAFVFNTASDSLSTSLGIADGQWHHIAVTYAPTGADTAVNIYFDHSLAATQTLSGAPAFGNGAGFTLGSAGFSGAIDELRLREGALGASDMLYATPPSATVILMK